MKYIEVLVTTTAYDVVDVVTDETLSVEERWKQAQKRANDVIDSGECYFDLSQSKYFHVKENSIVKDKLFSKFSKSTRFNNVSKILYLLFEDDDFTKEEKIEFLNKMKCEYSK